MNLTVTISIYAGGPGSVCEGSNCGRPKGAGGAKYRGGLVCVDFDNTLIEHKKGGGETTPRKMIPEGAELVRRLKSEGYRVVVLTARDNHDVVVKFLAKNNIPVDGVTSHKPPAIAYVDDRGVHWDRDVEKTMAHIKRLE